LIICSRDLHAIVDRNDVAVLVQLSIGGVKNRDDFGGREANLKDSGLHAPGKRGPARHITGEIYIFVLCVTYQSGNRR
jgi:hypothetical protein